MGGRGDAGRPGDGAGCGEVGYEARGGGGVGGVSRGLGLGEVGPGMWAWGGRAGRRSSGPAPAGRWKSLRRAGGDRG